MNYRCYLLLAVLALCTIISIPVRSQNEPVKLPEKIISGYHGWYPVNDANFDTDFIIRNYLDPLKDSGFTCFTAKIQNRGRNFDLKKPEQFQRVKILADACKERNLALLTYVYLYPDHRGRRDPVKQKDYPPLVLYDGTVLKDQFSLIYWPTWRMFLEKAYQLAEASRKLPIASVQVDLEHLGTGPVSYDDVAWKKYCTKSGLPVATPPAERYKLLKEKDQLKAYEDFFYGEIDLIAKRYEQEMHKINPSLSLGVMPDNNQRFIIAFQKHLGTPQAPAIIDNWLMYAGGGLTEKVLERQEFIKKLNPNNLFVSWFRPDNYKPDDIKVQAYYAVMKTDGYNMWHLEMLCNPAKSREKLPVKYTPSDYFNAFKAANTAALKDLKAGKNNYSIPFKPVKPLVADLNAEKLAAQPIPNLIPAGNGSGKFEGVRTRTFRCFYIYGKPGENLDIYIRHLAGDKRPVALQYAVITPDNKILRNESVSPSQKEKISLPVKKAGIYTLFVSGGKDTGPWYLVAIKNKHVAIPASKQNNARFFRPPATMWLTRKNLKDPAKITVSTGRNQIVELLIDDKSVGTAKANQPLTVEIPKDKLVHKVTFRRPEKLAKGLYCQTVWTYLSGAVFPYLCTGQEWRLVPADDK
jgi:hypothetical protein